MDRPGTDKRAIGGSAWESNPYYILQHTVIIINKATNFDSGPEPGPRDWARIKSQHQIHYPSLYQSSRPEAINFLANLVIVIT